MPVSNVQNIAKLRQFLSWATDNMSFWKNSKPFCPRFTVNTSWALHFARCYGDRSGQDCWLGLLGAWRYKRFNRLNRWQELRFGKKKSTKLGALLNYKAFEQARELLWFAKAAEGSAKKTIWHESRSSKVFLRRILYLNLARQLRWSSLSWCLDAQRTRWELRTWSEQKKRKRQAETKHNTIQYQQSSKSNKLFLGTHFRTKRTTLSILFPEPL